MGDGGDRAAGAPGGWTVARAAPVRSGTGRWRAGRRGWRWGRCPAPDPSPTRGTAPGAPGAARSRPAARPTGAPDSRPPTSRRTPLPAPTLPG